MTKLEQAERELKEFERFEKWVSTHFMDSSRLASYEITQMWNAWKAALGL